MKNLENKNENKISTKNWVIIWIAGLAGQLCWNIENQWFNTFVYAKIAPNPSIISWMVAVSAILTTLATFLLGTLSDRKGKRRPFIALGYIFWGVFTIAFGALEFLPKNNIILLGVFVVLVDGVMSFFGSFGSDAGLNPWTTDISNEKNRGGIGGAIAVQPVIATIVGSIGFGYIIGAVDYFGFFIIMGVFIALIGIYCLFAVKEAPDLKPNKDPKGYWHQFASAFNFKIFRENKMLLWTLITFAAFFISFDIYFPHILNYFIYTKGYSVGNAGLIFGIGLLVAIPTTLLASKFINKGKFAVVLSISVIVNIIGLLVITIPNIVTLVIGIFFVGAGYMCVYQTLTVMVKNSYPVEQRAQFEGLRLLFFVCIPMVIGPAIASPLIKATGLPMTNEYGESGFAPSNALLYVSAAMALLTFIPIYFANKEQKKVESLKNID
ncbi:MAG: MFS transporter [Clostridia bacterium]